MRQCLHAWCLMSVGALLSLVSGETFAQTSALGSSTIAGIVKDSSGGVLPGVLVEASSPALIERVRTITSDSSGQYRIVDLRPGTYAVTFSLPGFARYLREGVELEGTAVVTVNAELQVGALDETITVVAETPTVDLQSTVRQHVLSSETLDRIPTSRSFYGLGVLATGVSATTRDVGGADGNLWFTGLTAHGGRTADQRIMVSGLNSANINLQYTSKSAPNPEASQEVITETAGSTAERQTGGVSVNFIPKEGGNTFRGSLFVTATGERWQSSNVTQDLIDQGAGRPPVSMEKTVDVNPGLGGPIGRNRLWFYYSFRRQVGLIKTDMYYNVNAFRPDNWSYVADRSRQARSVDGRWTDNQARLTWQATPRHKIAASLIEQRNCDCPTAISPIRSPEAGYNDRNPVQRTVQAEWRSPLSDRVIVEVVGQKRHSKQGFMPLTQETSGVGDSEFAAYSQLIGVTVLNGGGLVPNQFMFHGPGPLVYAAGGGPFDTGTRSSYAYNGSATYLIGRHHVKVGLQDTFGYTDLQTYSTTRDPFGRAVRYIFSDLNTPLTVAVHQGTPDAMTFQRDDLDHDLGAYAQDRWTVGRLTMNVGVRFDWFKSSYPVQTLRATPNGRPAATLAGGEALDWKDVTTRLSAAYDLRGDGNTAVKVSLNKYVESQGLFGIATAANPMQRGITHNFMRSWNDRFYPVGDPRRGNFVVDCDVFNPAINGECTNAIPAAVNNIVPTPLTDIAVRDGWGWRPFNWEFSLGVQRELLPRVSVDVSYFRRSFGNFTATDNLAVNANDYMRYDITVPVDHRLPGGGAYVLRGYQDLRSLAAATSLANNRVVPVHELGVDQIERWNGIDATVRATPRSGLFLQAGTSTGRRYTNQCDLWALLPEVQGLSRSFESCEVTEPFRMQVKLTAAYTLPRVRRFPGALATVLADVQLAAVFQSIPGDAMAATYNMTNTEFARPCPSGLSDTSCSTLGRFLTNQTQATNTRAVNLLRPADMYEKRQNQFDLRIGRIVRVGGTRASVNLDLFNAFNASTVLIRNNTLGRSTSPGSYAAAQRQQADGGYNTLWVPTRLLQARFLKISATFDF